MCSLEDEYTRSCDNKQNGEQHEFNKNVIFFSYNCINQNESIEFQSWGKNFKNYIIMDILAFSPPLVSHLKVCHIQRVTSKVPKHLDLQKRLQVIIIWVTRAIPLSPWEVPLQFNSYFTTGEIKLLPKGQLNEMPGMTNPTLLQDPVVLHWPYLSLAFFCSPFHIQ